MGRLARQRRTASGLMTSSSSERSAPTARAGASRAARQRLSNRHAEIRLTDPSRPLRPGTPGVALRCGRPHALCGVEDAPERASSRSDRYFEWHRLFAGDAQRLRRRDRASLRTRRHSFPALTSSPRRWSPLPSSPSSSCCGITIFDRRSSTPRSVESGRASSGGDGGCAGENGHSRPLATHADPP